MNITFGERKLIKSNTLPNPVSSNPMSSVSNTVSSESIVSYKESESIFGGKGGKGDFGSGKEKKTQVSPQAAPQLTPLHPMIPTKVDPNSPEACKQRHKQRQSDIICNSWLAKIVGFKAAKIIYKIFSVLSTIKAMILFMWNILNFIIILMVIKIIMTMIEAGLQGSHGLLEGIRGILQKLHDLNLTIPLSKIKVPDIPVNINIPDTKLGTLSLSKASTSDINIPGVTIPGVTIPAVTIPDQNTPSVGTPGFNIAGVDVPGVTIPGVKIPGTTIPGASTPNINTPNIKVPGIRLPDYEMPTIPGFQFNKTFQIPTAPDIQANVFKPILGDPINKISQANEQIPNDSGEVLKSVAVSLFYNIGPFMMNMAKMGTNIGKSFI
jgi:hypothetical protein